MSRAIDTVSSGIQVLVVGAHPADGYSMLRFTSLIEEVWTVAGTQATVWRPAARFGSRLGKWGVYLDKYVVGLASLRRAAAKADIVHLAQQGDSMYALMPGVKPHFATIHDLFAQRAALRDFPSGKAPRLSGRAYQALNRAGLRRCAVLLADSAATASDARRLLGRQVPVVPVPIDARSFPAREAPVNHEDPYFLVVASTAWYKMRSATLRVFVDLKRHSPFAAHRLVIVGPLLTEQERLLAISLGVIDLVEVKSGVSDAALSQLYRSATAVLVTSSIEGFGWPYLEAQLHGTPLIAISNEVAHEVAGEGAIFLLSGRDSSNLGEVLLAQTPSIVAAGLENVQRFSIKTVAREYAQLLATFGS